MADLDAVYRQYASMIFRYLLAKTGSRELAEELTQETFYRAVGAIDRYDGSSLISTWLYGIARNVLLKHWSKSRGNLSLDDIPDPEAPSAEDEAMEGLSRQLLYAAIEELPKEKREVMRLRLGGLSFKEIAETLGKNEGWARVTYYRAKEQIIKELKNDE